jgi:hypothetical protein
MGVLVSATKLMYLTGARHDLEYQVDSINTARANLLSSINTLIPNGADMEPDSPEVKLLEQRKQRLMLIDKKLEQDLLHAQTKLDAIKSEEQQVSRKLQEQTQKA